MLADSVFKSAFNCVADSYTESGSLTRPEYKDKVEKNGSMSVEKIGDFDLDGMIQSSRDECLIYNILERAVTDPSVLNFGQGLFADVTSEQVPLSDHLQRVIDLQSRFDSLDPRLRRLFDNNMHDFINALQDGSADKRISDYIKMNSDQFIKKNESEVNTDESVSA